MTRRIILKAGVANKNYWRDLWDYRDLFYILSWKEFKVRYKETIIGTAWSVVRPLLTTIIFTFIFNRVAKFVSPGNTPYLLMVFTAMLPWQFFSNAVADGSNSLIGNSGLINKVYFPRIIVPISTIITSIIDLLISLVILLGMFLVFQFQPPLQAVLLPLFIALTIIISTGFAIFFSAVTVRFRDFRFIIPFVIQIGLYITPVGFSSSLIPEEWRWLYYINPMAGMVDGFRWCVLDEPMNWLYFTESLVIGGLFLLFGLFYFRSIEKGISDKM
jgi:lipopolysaccharide transport system permease protein